MTATITEILLRQLKVPHTRTYLREYIENLPLKDSLWAIAKVLEQYNVACSSAIIEAKEKILLCACPFVAQVSGNFVVITDISKRYIIFEDASGKHTQPINEFIKTWSGVVMFCLSDEESGEPDYASNIKIQMLSKLNHSATILAAIGLIILLHILNTHHSYTTEAGLLCSTIGFLLSVLLLKKHLRIPSGTAEKLCNIVGNGKCDEKIGQQPSKPHLPGNVDLSELGLSFFGVNNLALLLFHDNIIMAICLSLLLALPLSLWSIGWQLARRSWCPLCMMVMITIWIQEAIILLNNTIIIDKISILQFVSLICCYWLALQLVIFSVKYYRKQKRQKSEINKLQRFKYDKKIWEAILNSSEQNLPIDEHSASSLIFGDCNSQKPLVTIVGNPFCAPCARMHHRVQPLIDAGFQIQYLYTYFNPDLATINKQIVATYIRDGRTKTWEELTQWYDGDKSKHPFSPDNAKPIDSELESKVVVELQKHNMWIENSGIKATPTILIEGTPLPSNFVVEDLLYLY